MAYKLLYSLIIFLGAFLTFMFQPLTGKIVTPQYGGGADIWTSCLVFFQFMLFLGYLLSLFLNKLKPKTNAVVYSILFILSAVLFNLPTEFGSWIVNIGDRPLLSLFISLFKYAALPVLVLSTVSVSMQNWYTKQTGENPYVLYSVSNIGSFLALFIYPLCYEPIMTLSSTVKLWHTAFIALTLLVFGASFVYFAKSKENKEDREQADEKISVKKFLYWITLSAAGCVLLASYTTYATVRILPMPLLWTFFLGVYLLTFVLCFGSEKFYKKNVYLILTFVAAILHMLSLKMQFSVFASVCVLIFAFFVFLMILNGEIYRTRPNPSKLSEFYLAIAFGGVMGGFFVNIIAPLIFNGYYELPLINAFVYLFAIYLFVKPIIKKPFSKAFYVKLSLAIIITVVLAWFYILNLKTSNGIYKQKNERNFYGISFVQVNARKNLKTVSNGNTLHGSQRYDYKTDTYETTPLSYYSDFSALAFAVEGMRNYQTIKHRPLNIGVIGLGAGTTASYAEKGDKITFYEIDPKMVKIANEEFTYLKEAKGKVDIKTGDARLVLDKSEPGNYDVLLVDAFSSDAVPMHLITEEAFKIYKKHTKKDGIILFHISNRYLSLDRVLKKITDKDKLQSVVFYTVYTTVKDIQNAKEKYGSTSIYFVVFMPENKLYNNFKDFEYKTWTLDKNTAIDVVTKAPKDDKFLKPFTDEYSSTLRALKIWQ